MRGEIQAASMAALSVASPGGLCYTSHHGLTPHRFAPFPPLCAMPPIAAHAAMPHSFLNRSAVSAVLGGLLLGGYTPAALAEDKETLWQSGKNQHVRLVPQETSLDDTPPNDHPVELDEEELRLALEQLQRRDKRWFGEEVIYPVLSQAQRHILARQLAEGLARARPDQEIVFALAGKGANPRANLSFTGSLYTAGRVFYLDERLHLLFGDFLRPRDRGREAMAGQFGEYDVTYNFRYGRRAKRKVAYRIKEPLVRAEGLERQAIDGKKRLDWLIIDIAAAAEAVRLERRRTASETPAGRALEQAAQAARERFELRAEMARMRKEMRALSDETPGSGSTDIRQRISTLEQLRRDDLISEQEYREKRRAILSEI